MSNPLLFPPPRKQEDPRFADTRISAADYPGPDWPQDKGWEPTDVAPLDTRAASLDDAGVWVPTEVSPLEDRLSANQRHRLAGLYRAFVDMYKAIIHSNDDRSTHAQR